MTRTPTNTRTPTITPTRTLTPTPTPKPFLYPPFLGEGHVSSVCDHDAPVWRADPRNDRDRLVLYNGYVAACPTLGNESTPAPVCNGYPYDGHTGYDYAISYQPLVAAADVVAVERAKWDIPSNRRAGYGLFVVLRHSLNEGGSQNTNYRTLYGHLSSMTVQACDPCSYPAGYIIGTSGDTGASSGPHLHFSVFNGPYGDYGNIVDPYGWLPTQTPPVWPHNQRNSIWVNYPNNTSGFAVPGGTATPWPGLPATTYIVDDDPANVTNNPPTCQWTETTEITPAGTAQDDDMHSLYPINTGNATCFVKWPRPTNLPA